MAVHQLDKWSSPTGFGSYGYPKKPYFAENQITHMQ